MICKHNNMTAQNTIRANHVMEIKSMQRNAKKDSEKFRKRNSGAVVDADVEGVEANSCVNERQLREEEAREKEASKRRKYLPLKVLEEEKAKKIRLRKEIFGPLLAQTSENICARF